MRQNMLSKYESCKSICIKCMCVCVNARKVVATNSTTKWYVHLDGILCEHICCFRLRPNQPNQKSAFSITSAPATAGGGNIRVAKKNVVCFVNFKFMIFGRVHFPCDLYHVGAGTVHAACYL